jgi:hypothetical protein
LFLLLLALAAEFYQNCYINRIVPVCLSLEEVGLRVCHKVLVEVNGNILMIVSDPQGIFDQQLRPRPIYLLNVIIIIN